ncbi:MAG: isopeptide-forming domain-containing fimbrial protein [Clostridia bacterium]|nr:isopeptide-forming domain-containing fimbrial protein [Clostridia bacterium]
MKTIKTLTFAIILATILVTSLTLTAFATSITIDSATDGSEYSAYRLLTATDGGDGKFSYGLNGSYASVLETVTGKSTESDIVAYINSLETADDVRDFADAVYAEIVESAIEADYTASENTFESVEQGYYLIAETKVGNAADTFSLVMLDTAGKDNLTVNTKEGLPTIEKKVFEINDSTGASSWGDSADYDVNDVIKYKITGSVSEKYDYYNSYYYGVTDIMEKGLTYNGDAKVYAINGSTMTELTPHFSFTVTKNEESGFANGFVAESNLKEISGISIDGDTLIVIEYTATLNEYAVKGKPGNENTVYLEYENNPYVDADGDSNTVDKPVTPGKTAEDVNIVFTFAALVNKVDGDRNALAGAGFTLYKWNAETGYWVAVGDEITEVTTFSFAGLDAGRYKISETTVPEGYNKGEDIEFSILAEYDLTTDPDALTALKVADAEGNIISEGATPTFSIDLENGTITTTVENLAGAELPETGGIGTTIFYIAGSILAIGAIVLLVSKKVMAKN